MLGRASEGIRAYIHHLPKQVWLLILGMLLNIIGSSFLWPINMLYMEERLGLNLNLAGFLMSCMFALSAVGNTVGGILFDKIGGFRAATTGVVIAFIGLVGMNIHHEMPFYPIFFLTIGFGQGIVFPTMFAMIGTAWPEGGRKAFNTAYVIQNVGIAVGTALGGFLASVSYDYSFLGFLIMYAGFLLFTLTTVRKIAAESQASTRKVKQTKQKMSRENRRAFTAVMLIGIVISVCWFGYIQWQGTIPIQALSQGISKRQYSLFWTLNGAMIVLAQPFLTRILRKWQFSLKKQILIGLFIFAIAHTATGFANTFTLYLICMCILTAGEILVWPAVPTIAMNLAPKGMEGRFQGTIGTFQTGGRVMGPFFGTMIVERAGMTPLFITMTLLMGVAAFFTLIHDRWLHLDKEVSKRAA